MKPNIATVFLGLGLCQAALGGSPPLTPYANYGVVTQAPVVDAPSFLNAGDFEIDSVSSLNLTNLNNIFGNGYSVLPFMTKGTSFFTNTGLMTGIPGFRFDTGTSTSRHSANFFLNEGTLEGIDNPAFLYLFSVPGAMTAVPVPADCQPIGSQLLIMATNIVNTGPISVGNAGLLKMVGKNVTNSYASLAAGVVGTVGLSGLTNDPTGGLQGEDDVAFDGTGQYFFVPALGVYDLYWGVTNGDTINVEDLAFDLPFGLPPIITGGRGLGFEEFFENLATQYSVSSTLTNIGTNFYYNIVFINTNFADPNISVALGVLPGDEAELLQFEPLSSVPPADFGAFENIVQISEPVYDVISGQTVTNGIYLIDDGAILPSMTLTLNASQPGSEVPLGYDRPNAFRLTTATPLQWDEAVLEAQENPPTPYYIPQFIWSTDFNNNMQALEISDYGAQIGRNPADLEGSFSSLIEQNSEGLLNLEDFSDVVLPDPTNEPGRIEITGANVDLTQTRMRAEGMVILNATNIIGAGTGAMDWGQANINFGASNGALVISNIFPTTFQRVRGDIYVQSATWQNTQTNSFTTTNAATNQWYIHVLVVDQNLFGTFPSTVRSLKLTGKNSIVLQNSLNVIDHVVLATPNLTVTSTNFFSQNAASFTPANTPGLTNLFIGPGGLLGAANILDVGFNVSQGQTTPTGRKYGVNSIVNFGQMVATAPLLQSAYFENAGQITSDNAGSMVIQANVLSLGPALSNLAGYIDSQTNALGLSLTGSTNFLTADNSVALSGQTIEASNSVIVAGATGEGSLTLDVTKLLTDFVSGTPTTNTNSVIVNQWKVTGGFSLPVKPALGDLFGTEIHTMAFNNQQAIHVWAGTDLGPVNAGFVNNAVIGRLVLDRLAPNAVLRFSAAEAKNAMYVDYLELTNFALSNYRSGLVIDPNFKIYFADSNGDPQKLMEIYPGLVWVQSFAGPNSTQVVPYYNSSNVCLMNAALAQSTEISFFNGVANFYNQPYVLNNPNDLNATPYPCPGEETTVQSMLVSTPVAGGGSSLHLLNITINGEGSISPALQPSRFVFGSSHTLTATADAGWVFENWSTIGLSAEVNTNSRSLQFTFLSNTVITANFVPDPFTLAHGTYNGLFFEPNAVNPASSGAVSLTVAPSGSFSGRLLMGPSAYNFSSQFTSAGVAQAQAKAGAQPLMVNLQLDMTGKTGQVHGDVNGGTWDAALVADLAPAWTAQNPSPLAGNYTMVLPWATGTVAAPGGDSYGVGTVNTKGVLSMAGELADGATFSVAAPVSQGGQWPFYVYAAPGKDAVLGWVTVSNGLSGTNVNWSKAAGKGPLYQAGFGNVLQLVGSPWQAPAKESAALTLANPAVTLSGGGLTEPLTDPVDLQDFLTYAGDNLTLSIRPSNGSFSGWFISPAGGGRHTISGVVLQNEGRALGLFPGSNGSGTVLLEGQ
jgi:hypothetical protein